MSTTDVSKVKLSLINWVGNRPHSLLHAFISSLNWHLRTIALFKMTEADIELRDSSIHTSDVPTESVFIVVVTQSSWNNHRTEMNWPKNQKHKFHQGICHNNISTDCCIRTYRGSVKYANGNEYEGDFEQGKRHGHGVMKFIRKGEVYDGYWSVNVMQFLMSTRQWIEGQFHGWGKYVYHGGILYEGEWRRGCNAIWYIVDIDKV